MILNKMIAAVGLVGTLGAATPALADWHRPVPGPVVAAPGFGYVGWGYGHRGGGGYYGNRGYGYAPRYYHPYARRGWEGSRWHESRGRHFGGHRW